MHRGTYEMARRLLRDNGNSALEWMTPKVREEMTRLVAIKKSQDWLAERMELVAWCKRDGIELTPIQTRPRTEYRSGRWMGMSA